MDDPVDVNALILKTNALKVLIMSLSFDVWQLLAHRFFLCGIQST